MGYSGGCGVKIRDANGLARRTKCARKRVIDMEWNWPLKEVFGEQGINQTTSSIIKISTKTINIVPTSFL